VSEVAEYSAIETLQNARAVEIRPIRPDDRDRLSAAVGRTSADSLYRRFFAVNGISRKRRRNST
jgi:hypothetical protein